MNRNPRHHRLRPAVVLLILVGIGWLSPARARADGSDTEFFEKKIRPLLVESCYECHSSHSKELKGELRLDSAETLKVGGETGPVVTPGSPEKSRLIEAVRYQDPNLQMPPTGRLAGSKIDDLTEWVKRGAPWPEADGHGAVAAADGPAKSKFDLQKRKAAHWAWQPLRSVFPPAVKGEGWPADPLDKFVLSRLEGKGLAPAAAADRRTLIRRAYFDLIGLPPTPEQARQFVADASPDAWAKVVDGLLASPQFGERWARHWLDLVRYAETRGHEFDYDAPSAWQYRDYLIRAFNADVPYNQFVTEHIAGDLLEHPRIDPAGETNESVLATAFWLLGDWVHSPVDIRLDETDRVDNQIDVMGKTFLGLTLGCARCHDHKFDAISTKDYYSLAGFLESSSCRDVHFKWQEHNRQVAERIAAHDRETAANVVKQSLTAARPSLDRMADYLTAAALSIDAVAPGVKPLVDAERVQTRARHDSLDPAQLSFWIEQLKTAGADALHPFHPLALLAKHGQAATPDLAPKLLDSAIAAWKADQARAAAWPKGATIVADYHSPGAQPWIVEDLAFGAGPIRGGDLQLTYANSKANRAAGGAVALALETAAVSSPAGDFPGMLRTPEFTIAAPLVWYRVAGAGEAFIVVDSHRMIAGPLHAGTKQAINAGPNLVWQARDVRAYLGERAHIEFTPDQRSHFLAIAAVIQSESAPPEPSRVDGKLLEAIANSPPQSVAELAKRYQRVACHMADMLAQNHRGDELTPPAATTTALGSPSQPVLAQWLVQNAESLAPSSKSPAAVSDPVAHWLADRAMGRAELVAQIKTSPVALALLDGNGVDEHVLIRGSHKTPGEPAPRRFLEAIAGPSQPAIISGSGRLELARRMTDPNNPFVSRVMVNRIWHHLLGRGIVASVDNFGVLGDAPTNPELLDYLATEFIRDNWSIKRMIRRVALSSTYRMSSRPSERSLEVDPNNTLMQHMPIRRLESEAIRDSILQISGRLERRQFGPSVEVHLTSFMDGRGKPASGPLDGDGRRSIYLKVRRNFLSPMMMAFDEPLPYSTVGRRTVSNLPAQALILLNDPLVVEQAGRWALAVLADKTATPRERIAKMYETAFARLPSDIERTDAEDFLQQQGEQLGLAPAARASDPRVWADLCHVLLNVKEFIYIN